MSGAGCDVDGPGRVVADPDVRAAARARLVVVGRDEVHVSCLAVHPHPVAGLVRVEADEHRPSVARRQRRQPVVIGLAVNGDLRPSVRFS